MKENLVITISRQYGAGGRELAGILAEKLGVKLYDRQLVHLAAAKLGMARETAYRLRGREWAESFSRAWDTALGKVTADSHGDRSPR